jgi:hypothetical protein
MAGADREPPRRPAAGRWRRLSKHGVREVRYRTASIVGQRSYERFALVGHARTGSNYVRSGLVTSRAIRMYDELFASHSRTHGETFEQVMATTRGRQPRSVRLVGFKLFYYHLSQQEWDEFAREPLRGIVHLTRRNRLRTVVSLAIATKTDRWTGTSGHISVADKRLILDVSSLPRKLDEIEQGEASARERLAGANVLEVVYEDVIADPEPEFARIGRFLGADDIDPSRIALPRQNPEPLRELIANYDEVVARLAGTRHAAFLE